MIIGFVVLLFVNLLPALLGLCYVFNADFDELIIKRAGKRVIIRSFIIDAVALAVFFFIPKDYQYICLIVMCLTMILNLTLFKMKK